ncbi:MAG: SLBB domain-containing protein [Eubacteriales bacterium]
MRYRRKYQIRLWVAVLILLAGLTGCRKKTAVYDSAAEEITTEVAETDRQTTGEEKVASIWVYVCGEVRDPGVYELPEGSRITDAVEAAGGMTGDAAETYLNLAETLSDGQKIEVPSVEMAEALEEAAAQDTSGLVNLNRATEAELMTLSGIGESKAKEIIRYRESRGGFQSRRI